MQTFNLKGTRREKVGMVASRTSRGSDLIPCVLYGDGENIHFEVTAPSLKHLLYTPNVYKVMLEIDGTEYESLMREVQFHKVTDVVQHIDFLKLDPNKKVTCVVPIQLEGQSIGVKEGGKLVQRLRKVTIKAFPKYLIDKVVVDVTNLDVSKTTRLGEIEIENVEVLGSKSIPVAHVISPRQLKAMAEAAAAAEAAAKAPVAAATVATAATAETAAPEAGKEEKKE